MVDTRHKISRTFTASGPYLRFQTKVSYFFTVLDNFVVLTLRSAAYISCSGDFRADDDDAGRRQTYKTITLPLAHARGVIIVGYIPGQCLCKALTEALCNPSKTLGSCEEARDSSVCTMHMHGGTG